MKPKGRIIIKNWFGYIAHPTDKYINWCKDDEEEKEMAEKLREAYDGIVDKGAKDKLKYLLDAAYERGRFDENILVQTNKKEKERCPHGYVFGEDYIGIDECVKCNIKEDCSKKYNVLHDKLNS